MHQQNRTGKIFIYKNLHVISIVFAAPYENFTVFRLESGWTKANSGLILDIL